MTTAIEVSRLRYAYDAQDGGETHIVFDGLDLSVRSEEHTSELQSRE